MRHLPLCAKIGQKKVTLQTKNTLQSIVLQNGKSQWTIPNARFVSFTELLAIYFIRRMRTPKPDSTRMTEAHNECRKGNSQFSGRADRTGNRYQLDIRAAACTHTSCSRCRRTRTRCCTACNLQHPKVYSFMKKRVGIWSSSCKGLSTPETN